MEDKMLKVRFAPSPTGPFHIGGARSALFNWLLARKTGGSFVLRIEDTDTKRSTRESEENIKVALKWLGITWDEGIDVGGDNGPYRQSERLAIYETYTKKLLEEGKAYYCYCTPEEIEAERQEQMEKGGTPTYSGKCTHLTKEQVEAYEKEGRKPVIRLRVPKGKTVEFTDMVRGHVSFQSDGIGDFVIVKSDGMPVYNYSVVLDDALMGITDVIRAEEHLSNTPRQIVLYEALGLPIPRFGHISLILGKDYKKMSKRHGATSVEQYRNLGYLPQAIVNFLALLGWSPEEEKEIFSQDELIQQFSMDRVAKNPAVFDIDKLNWINFHYMKELNEEELYTLCLPHLQQAGYVGEDISPEKEAWLKQMVWTVRDHLSYGAQVVDHVDIFFKELEPVTDEEAIAVMAEETVPAVLATFAAKLEALEEVTADTVNPLFKEVRKELKVNGKQVFMPIRIALTGQMHGPELPQIIALLGKETVLERLKK